MDRQSDFIACLVGLPGVAGGGRNGNRL